jgi:hypothetical protein
MGAVETYDGAPAEQAAAPPASAEAPAEATAATEEGEPA